MQLRFVSRFRLRLLIQEIIIHALAIQNDNNIINRVEYCWVAKVLGSWTTGGNLPHFEYYVQL